MVKKEKQERKTRIEVYEVDYLKLLKYKNSISQLNSDVFRKVLEEFEKLKTKDIGGKK